MGRFVSLIYGLILFYLALEALWLDYLPNEFLPYAVILMGFAVMATPITSRSPVAVGGPVSYAVNPIVILFRRWIFGALLILMGLVTTIPWFQDKIGFFSYITTESILGSIIIASIAIIYFLSVFFSR